MADKDLGKDGPSLELPSFFGGRKKKAPPAASEPSPVEPTPEPEPVQPEPSPQRTPRAKKRRTPRPFTLPALPGTAAAAITGALVGLVLVALTYLALQGCDAVRGTSSCGAAGFVGLLVIVGVATWLAALILHAWRVAEPGTTAIMAVGLLVVVVLLFLIEAIYEWWMVLAIPLVGALTFALAEWVGSTFAREPESADQR